MVDSSVLPEVTSLVYNLSSGSTGSDITLGVTVHEPNRPNLYIGMVQRLKIGPRSFVFSYEEE